MFRYHDKRAQPAPQYKVGDLVMLRGKKLKTRQSSRKLDHKLHRPFAITRVITRHFLAGPAVTAIHLDLPVGWRCHSTFHFNLVEPYQTSKRGL